MTVFSRKNIALIIAELGKVSKKKTGQIRGVAALLKPLVVIGELKCDLRQRKNDRSNKKALFQLLY